MRRLDYVPSWLDGATTLLAKLNKCIEKIENLEIEDTQKINELTVLVNQVKETSENALSLAQTNETDISTNDGEIAELQGQVSDLNQEIGRTLKTPMQAPSVPQLVGVGVDNAQFLTPITDFVGGGTIYRHNLVFRNNNNNFDYSMVVYSSSNEVVNSFSKLTSLLGSENVFCLIPVVKFSKVWQDPSAISPTLCGFSINFGYRIFDGTGGNSFSLENTDITFQDYINEL